MHTSGAIGSGSAERRTVSYDSTSGTLVVGARSVKVHCAPGDNECLLRTYLDLVADQRDVRLDTAVHLRRDDITVLAQLLDLDDDSLEFRLRRLLRLSEREAAALARRLRRNRVALALGLGVLTAVPTVEALVGADQAVASPDSADAVAEASTTTTVSTSTTAAPTTVTVAVAAPEPEATVADASEPAPAPVDVGYAVRYERDPEFVPPPGVDIGDAMFIERDAPPAP
jgi:hypothetical protein